MATVFLNKTLVPNKDRISKLNECKSVRVIKEDVNESKRQPSSVARFQDPPLSFWESIQRYAHELSFWNSFSQLPSDVQRTIVIGFWLFLSLFIVVAPSLFLTFVGLGILIHCGICSLLIIHETSISCQVKAIQADLVEHINSKVQDTLLQQSEFRLKSKSSALKGKVSEERLMAKALEDVNQFRVEIARLRARVEVIERRTEETNEIMQLQSEVNEFQCSPELLNLLLEYSSDDDTD